MLYTFVKLQRGIEGEERSAPLRDITTKHTTHNIITPSLYQPLIYIIFNLYVKPIRIVFPHYIHF